MLFNAHLCDHIYYCNVVVGPGSQLCTLLEVWVLGVGMSTLGAQTSLYFEDRGFQVPMTMEHGNIVGTQCCDTTVPHLVSPDCEGLRFFF
jgi:hypothetical protein